jgi:hypothetical protein
MGEFVDPLRTRSEYPHFKGFSFEGAQGGQLSHTHGLTLHGSRQNHASPRFSLTTPTSRFARLSVSLDMPAAWARSSTRLIGNSPSANHSRSSSASFFRFVGALPATISSTSTVCHSCSNVPRSVHQKIGKPDVGRISAGVQVWDGFERGRTAKLRASCSRYRREPLLSLTERYSMTWTTSYR